MNNPNGMDMDIDNNITPVNNNTENDHILALITQQDEIEGATMRMTPLDIANFEKRFYDYQQIQQKKEPTSIDRRDGTENDEEIARILQINNIYEGQIINNILFPYNQCKSNKMKCVDLKSYHNTEIQKQIQESYTREKLTPEYFKDKLNSEEGSPIRKLIQEFYVDFKQKTMNYFKSPDEQSQYLRNFLDDISRVLIENPLWANCEKEEQENAIIEIEKVITKKLYKITFGPPDDLAKDTLLSHKILMYSWVEPRHLNLPDFDYHIFEKAGIELTKMNDYRFYVDKIICIVNCIKLIEDAYIKNISDNEELSLEKHLILLIFVILKTNPTKLISNIQYIVRYCNPHLLKIGIYDHSLSIMGGSLKRIEEISLQTLNVTPEEYEAKIYEMTRIINEKHEEALMNQGIQREKSSSSTSSSIIQSLKSSINKFLGYDTSALNRFFFGNDTSADSNIDEDFPYLGLFAHIDSVNSANSFNSLNRNGSSISSNSFLVREYRKELSEQYNMIVNEPITRPFESRLTEEEVNNLVENDKELKASLSINSNKDNN